MKKLILLAGIALLVGVAAASAQTDNADKYIELFRSDLSVERVDILTEALDLTAAEGEAFWPIYREYDLERAKLGDRNVALINKFADHYTAMTEDVAKDLVHDAADIQQDRIKLRKKYFDKAAKVIPAHKAARFYQVDSVVDQIVGVQIAGELPLFD
jgi:hypothetical protein